VISAGASPTNLDAFAQAISQAAAVGAQLTAFVLHPADALAFAKLKSGTALNTPLLQPDPAQPTRNVVFGVPLLVSPQATQGVIGGSRRPDPHRRPGGRHGGDRPVGVLHQRPGRGEGRHAGRLRLLHNAAMQKINLAWTSWPGVKVTAVRQADIGGGLLAGLNPGGFLDHPTGLPPSASRWPHVRP